MNPRILITLICLLLASGCTSEQLRHNTLNQTATLPDIQHQVVLSNLAAFAYDPFAIPFHATPSDGTTQIQDNGSITSQLLVATARTLELGLSRTAVDQWSMAPVTESISIRLLRAAYRRVFDPRVDLYFPDEELANDLAHELKKQTTTVDDLRTTNQIGNAGLNAVTAAGSSSMVAAAGHGTNLAFAVTPKQTSGPTTGTTPTTPNPPSNPPQNRTLTRTIDENFDKIGKGLNRIGDSIGSGLDKIGNGIDKLAKNSQQDSVLLSNKTEPDIVGFNNDSIAKFMFESESVLSSNDDQIVLDDEFLGKNPGSLNSQLFQIKLPEWISEKIELPIDGTHELRDYRITLSDPARPVSPLHLAFSTVLKENAELDGKKMDNPVYLQTTLAMFRKLKRYIDAEVQRYYGSIDCVVSLGIDDFDYENNVIQKLSLVVSFPAGLARHPNKLVGSWGPHPLVSQDYPRYMAATPLVAELRRQVAEVERTLIKIQPGWVGRSRDKHDVPSNACYKLCWKDCNGQLYVWVCPEGKAAFEDFTIAILELSSVIKNVNLSGSTGVKFTPGSGAPTLGAGK
jgi:hypothetical protein